MKGKDLVKILGGGAVILLAPKMVVAGDSKVYNWSDHAGVANCEKVLLAEDFSDNGSYLAIPGNTNTRMYGWGPTIIDPNNHKLSGLAIDSDKTYFNKLFLAADTLVPDGADNYLKIKKTDISLSFEKRETSL